MPDLESSRPTPNSGNSPGPHHGYDPNQPRVPSGHSDGGQWTKTGRRHSRDRAPRGRRRPQQAGKLGLLRRRLPRRRLARRAARVQSRRQPDRLRVQAARRPRRLGRAPHRRAPRRHQVHIREQRQCAADLRRRRQSGQRHRMDRGWSAPAADRGSWHSSGPRSPPAPILLHGSALPRHRPSTPPPSRFSRGFRAGRIPTAPRSSLSTLRNTKSLKQMGMRSAQLFSWDL